MRLLKALVVAATTLSVFAGPLRYTRRGQDNNILVFQFASVLESLENEFYKQGIAKFTDQDFQNAGFSSTSIVADSLQTIQGDEQAHLDFLTKALAAFGSAAPDNCQFSFDSVLTDVPTMAAVARVVEMTGVAAYAGAAGLLTDPQLISGAATILTAEARHQTILNTMSGVGSPIPQAFDMALGPSEVLAIAGPFISGCDLGIPSNKPLTVTNTGTPGIGTTLTFDFDGKDGNDNLHCQMMVGGAVNSISLPIDQCTVPEGINGPVALWITSDQQPLVNNVVLRQYANNVVAGPTIAFIDSLPNPLSQLIRVSGNGGSGAVSDVQSGSGAQPGSPNFNTGTEAGGAVIVDGWTNLPNGEQPPSDGTNNLVQGQDGESQSQDGQPQDGEQPPSDPNAPPEDPNAPPSDPNAPPEDPNAPPSDPNAPPEDPNAPPSDPNAPPQDPNAPPSDPNAPPADPNAAPNAGAVIVSSP